MKNCIILIYLILSCGCKDNQSNINYNPSVLQEHDILVPNSKISVGLNLTVPKSSLEKMQDSLLALPINSFSYLQISHLLTFIKEKDQELRGKHDQILQKHDWVEANRQVDFGVNDTLCRNVFDKIVEVVGFPDNKRFGFIADTTVFLLLAHAPTVYRIKYINEWEVAVKANSSNAGFFADIKDRTLIATKSWQLYATQYSQKDSLLLPIKDLQNLNNRRASMGLPPMDIKKIKQTNF